MQRQSGLLAMAFLGGWIISSCVDGEGTSAMPCFDDIQCPINYQCYMNYCIPGAAESVGDGDGDPATTGDPETGDPETGDGDPETGDGDPETGDGDPGDGDPETGDGDPETGDGDGDPCTPGTAGCSCDAGACAQGLVCNEDYLCVPGACGDGVVMGNEECEEGDLQGTNCEDLGFEGGLLGCNPNTCQFDTSECSDETCGNGIVDIGEQCDTNNLNGFDCLDLGYSGGQLGCDPVTCTYDASGCIFDGDEGGTG